MIGTPCKSNINIVVGNYVLSENIPFNSDFVVYDEIPSTPFQTIEQVEVIQEVVFSEVSKLNNSVIKKQRDQTQFFPKNPRKRKLDLFPALCFHPTIDITQIDGSCYRIIDHQF